MKLLATIAAMWIAVGIITLPVLILLVWFAEDEDDDGEFTIIDLRKASVVAAAERIAAEAARQS